MFVTILSSIYLALAIFVIVRFVHKKRQKIADWAAEKGYGNSYIYKVISTKSADTRPKSDISKVYID